MVRLRLALILALVAVAAVACGGQRGRDVVGVVTGAGEVQERKVTIPSQVLGLNVQAEDISKQLKSTRRPYLDNVGLFSLREKDLVRATFQISRFNDLARPDDPTFRNSIIGLLGSSKPQKVQVGGDVVYVTTGNEQSIFVWFREKGFFVLTCHQQYEFPRTLLRRMLQLEPAI